MSTIKIELEIGHEASLREKRATGEIFTHDWEVFVRGLNNCDIKYYVDKVVFNLHETFKKARRVYKEPPYAVRESGYAGFVFPIEIYLKNNGDPKKITFNYDLTLQQAGPAILKVQRERYIFHNPTEEFRDRLLKGGGVIVVKDSDTLPSTTSSVRTLDNSAVSMSSKDKYMNDAYKKYKSTKSDEPKMPTNSFQALFGPPITKTSQVTTKVPEQNKVKSDVKSSTDKSKLSPNERVVDKSGKGKHVSSKPSSSSSYERDSDRNKAYKSDDVIKKERRDKEEKRDKIKDKSSKRDKSPKVSSKSTEKIAPPPTPASLPPIVAKKEEALVPSTQSMQKESSDTRDNKQSDSSKKSKKDKRDKERSKDKEKKSHSKHSIIEETSSLVLIPNEPVAPPQQPAQPLDKEKKDTKHKDTPKEARVKDKKTGDSVQASHVPPKDIKPEKLDDITTEKHHHKHKKRDKEKKREEKERKAEKKSKEYRELKKSPAPIADKWAAPLSEHIEPAVAIANGTKNTGSKQHTKHVIDSSDDNLSDDQVTVTYQKEKFVGKKSDTHATQSILVPPQIVIQPPAPTTPTCPSAPASAASAPSPTAGLKVTDASSKTPGEKKKSKKRHKHSKGDEDDEIESGKKAEKSRKRKSSSSTTIKEADSTVEDESTQPDALLKVAAKPKREQEATTSGQKLTVDAESNKKVPRKSVDKSDAIVKSEQATELDGRSGAIVTSSNNVITHDYMMILKDLQNKIMTLQDNSELQRVVQLIAETGQYELTSISFDFDLCALDRTTVKRLQDFFASNT